MASPSLDGNAVSAAFAASASGGVTLSTTQTNDIIVVWVMGSRNATTVTGITDGASVLTFVPRPNGRVSVAGGQFIEEWYAPSSGLLTNDTITVTTSASTGRWVIVAYAVQGTNIASPFDTNAGLPFSASGTSAAPSVTTSTTLTNTLIIAGVATSQNTTATAGSGFAIPTNGTLNSGSGVTGSSETGAFAAAQSSLAVAFSLGASGTWSMITDAFAGVVTATTSGAIGAGFSATVIVNQAAVGSIGSDSGAVVANQGVAVAATIGTTLQGSASAFGALTFLSYTERGQRIFKGSRLAERGTTVPRTSNLSEWGEFVFALGQSTGGGMGLGSSGTLTSIGSQVVAGAIGSQSSAMETQNQATIGVIGFQSSESGSEVISNQQTAASIGVQAAAVALPASQLTSASIGSQSAAAVALSQVTAASIGSQSALTATALSQAATGSVGAGFANVSALSAAIVAATIGMQAALTATSLTQAATGAIGSQTTAGETLNQAATGSMGIQDAGVALVSSQTTAAAIGSQSSAAVLLSQAVAGAIGSQSAAGETLPAQATTAAIGIQSADVPTISQATFATIGVGDAAAEILGSQSVIGVSLSAVAVPSSQLTSASIGVQSTLTATALSQAVTGAIGSQSAATFIVSQVVFASIGVGDAAFQLPSSNSVIGVSLSAVVTVSSQLTAAAIGVQAADVPTISQVVAGSIGLQSSAVEALNQAVVGSIGVQAAALESMSQIVAASIGVQQAAQVVINQATTGAIGVQELAAEALSQATIATVGMMLRSAQQANRAITVQAVTLYIMDNQATTLKTKDGQKIYL